MESFAPSLSSATLSLPSPSPSPPPVVVVSAVDSTTKTTPPAFAQSVSVAAHTNTDRDWSATAHVSAEEQLVALEKVLRSVSSAGSACRDQVDIMVQLETLVAALPDISLMLKGGTDPSL